MLSILGTNGLAELVHQWKMKAELSNAQLAAAGLPAGSSWNQLVSDFLSTNTMLSSSDAEVNGGVQSWG